MNKRLLFIFAVFIILVGFCLAFTTLPDKFVADTIPCYPKVIYCNRATTSGWSLEPSSTAAYINFKSTDGSEDIAKFYRSVLVKAGWKETSYNVHISNLKEISGQPDSYQLDLVKTILGIRFKAHLSRSLYTVSPNDWLWGLVEISITH